MTCASANDEFFKGWQVKDQRKGEETVMWMCYGCHGVFFGFLIPSLVYLPTLIPWKIYHSLGKYTNRSSHGMLHHGCCLFLGSGLAVPSSSTKQPRGVVFSIPCRRPFPAVHPGAVRWNEFRKGKKMGIPMQIQPWNLDFLMIYS